MKCRFRRWTWCSFGIFTNNSGVSILESRGENIQKDNFTPAFSSLVSMKVEYAIFVVDRIILAWDTKSIEYKEYRIPVFFKRIQAFIYSSIVDT